MPVQCFSLFLRYRWLVLLMIGLALAPGVMAPTFANIAASAGIDNVGNDFASRGSRVASQIRWGY